MPRYSILDQYGLNYVTCTVVGWVDVFTRKTYRDIVLESLAYCRKEKGLIVCAYVIMSNHIHMIVRADGELSARHELLHFRFLQHNHNGYKLISILACVAHPSTRFFCSIFTTCLVAH